MGLNKLFMRKLSVSVDPSTDISSTSTKQLPALPQEAPRRPFISLWGAKSKRQSRPNRPAPSKKAAEVLGGKYLSKKHASLRSIDTEDITEPSMMGSWKSCRSEDYQKAVATTPLSEEARRSEWGRAIVDARRLPRTSKYANNHIMVNIERTKRTIPAVKRCSALDAVARWHAETMAAEGKVRHSDSRDLQARLKEQVGEHLGENVGAGESIRAIHHEMMQNVGDSRNMTDRRYKEMGMATARGKNGELFLCQIFRG